MGSEEERNRLKEEYKDHYRKIRELKTKLADAERMKRLSTAVENINPRGILDQFDDALSKVREKIFTAEAKLDMAMESADASDTPQPSPADEEVLRKQKASETMRQMKIELGMLNDAVEEQAAKLPVQKTLGKKPESRDPMADPLSPNNSPKSLGRPTDKEP